VRYLYIGEIGYGNLGDDGCAYLVKERLGDELTLKAFSEVSPDLPLLEVVMIGGGTLLSLAGTPWMETMLMAARCAKRRVMLGTGVDPGIPWSERGIRTVKQLTDLIEIEDRGVRGPISQAALAAVGIPTTIVGDPMFLYEPPEGRKAGAVGIVPGHQGRSVGGPHFHERMCGIIRIVGNPIRYIPVWIRDVGLEQAYQRETGLGQITYPGKGFHSIAKTLGECRAVITNRMHAGIVALTMGVPAFFIAHHIKVTDLCLALSWPHYAPADDPNLATQCGEFVRDAHKHVLPWPQIEGFRRVLKEMLRRVK